MIFGTGLTIYAQEEAPEVGEATAAASETLEEAAQTEDDTEETGGPGEAEEPGGGDDEITGPTEDDETEEPGGEEDEPGDEPLPGDEPEDLEELEDEEPLPEEDALAPEDVETMELALDAVPDAVIALGGGETLTILDGGAYEVDTGHSGLFDENTVISTAASLNIVLANTAPATLKSLQGPSADVAISGSGHLILRNPDEVEYASQVAWLSLADATVEVHGGLNALRVVNGLDIASGNLTAEYDGSETSDYAFSNGLLLEGSLTMQGGTLTGVGGGGTNANPPMPYMGFAGGIAVFGNINQTGGVITGSTPHPSMSRAGVVCRGDILVSGSGTRLEGHPNPAKTSDNSMGVLASGNITVTDEAVLEGTGGDDWCAGVYVGAMSVNFDATLRVENGASVIAQGFSRGLSVGGTMIVSGGSSVHASCSGDEARGRGGIGILVGMYSRSNTSITTSHTNTIISGNSSVLADGLNWDGIICGSVQISDAGSSFTGKAMGTGINMGALQLNAGSVKGVASGQASRTAIGVRMGVATINGGSLEGEVTGTSRGGTGIVQNVTSTGPITQLGGTVTGTVAQTATGGNCYGIEVLYTGAPMQLESGTLTGTALSGTGIWTAGGINVATAAATATGNGGHTGVHSEGAVAVTGGALAGTSHGAVEEQPGTRSGVYSAAGGISVQGGSLTGTTNQYYTTTSGAVNANGAGVQAAGGGTVAEYYNTPYQYVNMLEYTTPFAGVSLTVAENEFANYTWSGDANVDIDQNEGVKALAPTGTAALSAARSGTAGNKTNMQLAAAQDTHEVYFSVLLEPGVDYSVTFEPNGGAFVAAPGTPLQKRGGGTVTRQEALEDHAVVYEGHIFAGWAVNSPKGSVHNFDDGPYTVLDDVTFYAQWLPMGVACRVYYLLDGTENDEVPVEVATGCLLGEDFPHGTVVDAVPDPEDLHEKYEFVGCNMPYTLQWVAPVAPAARAFAADVAAAPAASARAIVPTLANTPNAIIMRYAVRSFTVRYEDPNGNLIGEEIVVWGEDGTPPTAPLRPGENFTSWLGDYLNVTSNRTIVAQYTPLAVQAQPLQDGTPPNTPQTGDSLPTGLLLLGAASLLAAVGGGVWLLVARKRKRGGA